MSPGGLYWFITGSTCSCARAYVFVFAEVEGKDQSQQCSVGWREACDGAAQGAGFRVVSAGWGVGGRVGPARWVHIGRGAEGAGRPQPGEAGQGPGRAGARQGRGGAAGRGGVRRAGGG